MLPLPDVDADPQPDVAPARGWMLTGVRAALSGPAFVVAVSLVGVGGLAHDAGQPLEIAVLSTLLIWAGPAQVIYFTGLATNVAPAVIATAVCLVGFRFLPMCVACVPSPFVSVTPRHLSCARIITSR